MTDQLTPPLDVVFDGLEVPVQDIISGQGKRRPIPANWQRVQFPIPDGYTSAKAVEEWLTNNCPNDWTSYHYNNPKNKNSNERIMIVRFQDKNDALLFKLRGGHQAWEL